MLSQARREDLEDELEVLARVAGEAADYGTPESEAARELSHTIAKLRAQLAAAEAEEAAAAAAAAVGAEGGEAADDVPSLLRRHAKLQAAGLGLGLG